MSSYQYIACAGQGDEAPLDPNADYLRAAIQTALDERDAALAELASLKEQLDAEKSARVRDIATMGVTLDQLRAQLASLKDPERLTEDAEGLRRFIELYVPAGFRDDDGIWHDRPHRTTALAYFNRIVAASRVSLGER